MKHEAPPSLRASCVTPAQGCPGTVRTRRCVRVILMCTSLPLTSCDPFAALLLPDAYRYTAYDPSGATIVTGWMVIRPAEAGALRGEWHFTASRGSDRNGPHNGDRMLIGGVENDEVWVELNPQFRDNNLQLRGHMDGKRYSGRWARINFAGITNAGPFVAVRR